MKSFFAALALGATFAAHSAANELVPPNPRLSFITPTSIAGDRSALYLETRPNYRPIATTALDKLLLRKAGA